jgi:hypothetical protein
MTDGIERHRRALTAIYAGSAVVLAPWIVFLWSTQPTRGLAHDVAWLTGGLVAVLSASAAITGALCAIGSRVSLVSAGFTGSLAFATLWFKLTAPAGHGSAWLTGRSIVVLSVPMALLAWILRSRSVRSRPARFTSLPLAVAYWTSAALLLAGALRLAAVAPTVEVEHHLRLVWSGLDMFELIGLATTARCIHARSRLVVLPTTFTAALLTADAWTNVTASTGAARSAAAGMAVIELSLVALSLSVAWASLERPARVGQVPQERRDDVAPPSPSRGEPDVVQGME